MNYIYKMVARFKDGTLTTGGIVKASTTAGAMKAALKQAIDPYDFDEPRKMRIQVRECKKST